MLVLVFKLICCGEWELMEMWCVVSGFEIGWGNGLDNCYWLDMMWCKLVGVVL